MSKVFPILFTDRALYLEVGTRLDSIDVLFWVLSILALGYYTVSPSNFEGEGMFLECLLNFYGEDDWILFVCWGSA